MTRNRDPLSQLDDKLFLTDGGLETTLTFLDRIELRDFSAYEFMADNAGISRLRGYFTRYADIAKRHGVGFILESPTWRASAGWGARHGRSASDLANLNRRAIEMLRDLRDEHATADTPMLISGCIGPRGDGYNPVGAMDADEARQYHTAQVVTFRNAGVDLVTATTMTYSEEAVGVVRAANELDLPVVVSFTVETDGTLPTGQHLRDAIRQIDRATDTPPAYYMINCAHPTHFERELASGEAWTLRVRGLRISRLSAAAAEPITGTSKRSPATAARPPAARAERHPVRR